MYVCHMYRNCKSHLMIKCSQSIKLTRKKNVMYYNITLLQNFNHCARTTCTITDNRHSLRITSTDQYRYVVAAQHFSFQPAAILC